MMESLPCSACSALCCGPVPLFAARMEKIEAYVAAMPATERRRLAAQERSLLDCRFLDKENNHCAIYPVRPWLCELFGRVEGMPCPRASGPVQMISEFLAETKLEEEHRSGSAGNSSHFQWK
jgi:Fe-S-cluster containining protein